MNEPIVDRVIRGIREVHGDTTVAPEKTLDRLEIIAEELDCLISALKDEIADAAEV